MLRGVNLALEPVVVRYDSEAVRNVRPKIVDCGGLEQP